MIHVDFVYQPMRNEYGNVSGIFVLGSDVTARHQAHEALRSSEETLRMARDAAQLGIHIYDIPSDVIEWDSRVRALWGVDADEKINYAEFKSGLHADDLAATTAAVQRALDPAGDGRYSAEYRVRHRQDGTLRWVRATGQTFFAGGQPQRLVGTTLDISEHKNAETSKNLFLATLGHELRNPLAALRNATALADALPADEDRRQWAQNVVKRQIAHMTRLVDDLVDVARIAYGRIELQKQPVLLSDLVQQALDVVKPALEQSGHRLTVSQPAEPVPLHVDPVRLTQVLSNVLLNAVKYSAAGSAIHFTAERSAAGGELLIRIEDQGIGLAAHELESVFDLFSQAGSGRDQARGGMGIGLSLARTLVNLHEGHIQARSAGYGLGAEFTIALPLPAHAMPPAPPAPAEPAEPTRHPVDGCRVLVVDDNEDAARTLALLMELEGAQVGLAFNGTDALARADALRPEILLLDIGLPDMSGHELCRQIRKRPWGARAIIVAQTGWGQEADRQRSHDAGFDEHIVKPVQVEALARVLGTVQALRRSAAASGA
ncbi:MAG: response regulator [Rubrivivax sp.]|nr:response regulator [Rubrivivax sp.]